MDARVYSGSGITLLEEKKAKERIAQLFSAIHHDCMVQKQPKACHQLGEYYEGMEKDGTKAADLYEEMCFKHGFAESCLSLGNIYITGNGRDRSLSRAVEVLEKGCAMGSLGACNNAGLVYMNQKETVKAVAMFEKACSRDFKNACFNLSGVYIQGMDGVEKDMKKAFEYASKSCVQGHPLACANVSRMYKLGEGVMKDAQQAESYKRKALELNR